MWFQYLLVTQQRSERRFHIDCDLLRQYFWHDRQYALGAGREIEAA